MSEPMLTLEGIRLVYNRGRVDEVTAIDHLDLSFDPGEFVTVVGSNGAGKSSSVQIISGAQRPTQGRVMIRGKDVTRWPDYRRASMVARVFDDPRVGSAPDLSIEDNLSLAMNRGRRRTLRFSINAARRARMRDELARLGLGLEDRLHDPMGMLSAGQRQSITMIMAGLTAPDVLLLDEHLAALDPATAARVLTLTGDLVAEMGCTALMITHNMEHALAMGSRMLVMSRGRVIADMEHERKRLMDTSDVVALMVDAGDVLTDRILLPELQPEGAA